MSEIETLGLSDRARNALRRNDVATVEQLMEMTPGELSGLRGVGVTLYTEITEKLREYQKRNKKRNPRRR